MNELRVRMLGGPSLSQNGVTVDGKGSRPRKTWLLLCYFLCNRHRSIGQEELIRLLWGSEEARDDPANALRVILHRTRAILSRLGMGDGYDFILRDKLGYRWNPEHPAVLDTEEFESLCLAGQSAETDGERLELFRQAISLYQGDFLDKYSGESWVRSTSVHYSDLYAAAVFEALRLLTAAGAHREAVGLCRTALNVLAYNEGLYLHLMRSHLALGEQQEAAGAYEEIREALIANFDVLPSEELRGLYYEAIRKINSHSVPIERLMEQLQEPGADQGALICEFDFFKVLYYSTARLAPRSGSAIHLALLSVSGKDGAPLPKRTMAHVMDCLQEQARFSLRRGDAITRCSVSQFALLLQLINYENSCMVCERIIRSYYRKYPHSSAALTYSIQPIRPVAT